MDDHMLHRADWSAKSQPDAASPRPKHPGPPFEAQPDSLEEVLLRPGRADHSVPSLQTSLKLPVTLYCDNVPGRGWMLFISVPRPGPRADQRLRRCVKWINPCPGRPAGPGPGIPSACLPRHPSGLAVSVPVLSARRSRLPGHTGRPRHTEGSAFPGRSALRGGTGSCVLSPRLLGSAGTSLPCVLSTF